jgi:hypothetical protein
MKVIFMARKALPAYLIRHHAAGAVVVKPDDDAVGPLEVINRSTLAQEFRIGDDGDVGAGIGLARDPLDLVAGADRDRRLGDDDREAGDMGGDLAGRVIDIRKIGMAVAAPGGGADCDEDDVALRNAGCKICGEAQPSILDVVGDQLFEAGLEDRDAAGEQRFDLARVLVDADHFMAEIGKTNAGNKSDITGTDHRDFHGTLQNDIALTHSGFIPAHERTWRHP